jgi:nitroreductase
MACMNLMLQATREGLYAHPIAGFAPRKAKAALGVPEDFVLVALIVCGKPGDPELLDERNRARESSARERKSLDEVAFRERWPT